MNLTTWLAVVSICALGAMSPGPSLAVVLRHTLAGGRRHGLAAALAHALGIGFYALACISGLAYLIIASPGLFQLLQWGGAIYLLWLGGKGLRAKPAAQLEWEEHAGSGNAARDGFLVVFLNPKIAVFFIALFSQVISPDSSLPAKLLYAGTAMVIDGAWYVIVAWGFSNPRWLPWLQARSVWLERLFGLILIALALRLLWQTLAF